VKKIFLFLLPTLFAYNLVLAQFDYYALAKIEMQEQNYNQAETYFVRALQQNPANTTILNDLSLCLLKQRKFNYADSMLKIAIDKDSNFAATYWNLGIVNVNLKADSVAIIWFNKHIHFSKKENPIANPAKTHTEIIRCYDRIMKREGLSKSQLENLRWHVDKFKILAPEAHSELTMLDNMMFDYSPANPKFKFKNGRHRWELED
jgi:Tfp pilus assembly protein PilF